MITDSFDPKSAEIVKAKNTIPQKDKELAHAFFIDTFILTFSGNSTRGGKDKKSSFHRVIRMIMRLLTCTSK